MIGSFSTMLTASKWQKLYQHLKFLTTYHKCLKYNKLEAILNVSVFPTFLVHKYLLIKLGVSIVETYRDRDVSTRREVFFQIEILG